MGKRGPKPGSKGGRGIQVQLRLKGPLLDFVDSQIARDPKANRQSYIRGLIAAEADRVNMEKAHNEIIGDCKTS